MNEFVSNPNLPSKKVTSVLIDFRTAPETVKKLNSLGICVYTTKRTADLYDAVSGHPDMIMHHLGENRVVVCESSPCFVLPHGLEITEGKSRLTQKYPYDIAYNAARVGNFLIHNFRYTDAVILEHSQDLTRIDVAQGYAKCSVCVVAENAVITSDLGIAKKCDTYGIDVLVTDDSDISLKGVSHGFIGGSTGLLAPDLLGINGDIHFHRNCEGIQCFCEKYGVNILSLKDGVIEDIGSIIVLTE